MKNSSHPAMLILAAAVLLGGCAGWRGVDHAPRISDISLDESVMPEIDLISVPMPPPSPARTPGRADGASLWQGGSDSFFDDQRASQVGDIVTINIVIDDNARMNNQTRRSREGSASIANPSIFGAGVPSLLGGENPENIVDLSSTLSGRGSGSIERNERVRLKLAALVVQVLPNGNFVVAGRQEVMINEELRELRVAGVIKPQDISPDNSISYEKIAEARITYGGRGQISRQQRTGYGEGALNIILPY